MRVPAAREIGRETSGALEVASFREQPEDHSRDLAHLHMLQAQLAEEPRLVGFSFERPQAAAVRGSENLFFLPLRVVAKQTIEFLEREPRGLDISFLERHEKFAEEVVKHLMLAFPARRESGFRHHSTFFVALGRPSTGSRIAASGSAASKP